MKRETGYYWVKVHIKDAWQTAFYSEISKMWSTLSASLQPIMVDDTGWFEINETRILNPEEPIEKINDNTILEYGWQRDLNGDRPCPRLFKIEFKFTWQDMEPTGTEVTGKLQLYYSRDGYMKISKEMMHYDRMFSGGCSNKKEFLMLMEMLEVNKFLSPKKNESI